MMRSIRRRLLVGLLGLFSLGWLGVSALTYHSTARQVDALFDADLIDFTRVLSELVGRGLGNDPEDMHEILTAINSTRADRRTTPPIYCVWDRNGDVVLSSPNAPATLIEPRSAGFVALAVAGRPWRGFVVEEAGPGLTLLVAEPARVRETLVFGVVRDALAPLALALPMLGLLIWFGVGRGLAPLLTAARQVAARSPERLDPLPLAGVPDEIATLVREINRLLGQLDAALAAERRLTADAAHEIRTPLASLKTHVQVALRSSEAAVYGRALMQVEKSVDRIAHLMEQILLLARLDAETVEAGFTTVDLGRVAAEAVAVLAAPALERGIDLAVDSRTALPVRGNAAGLGILVGNLVANAIRHAPDGGHVRVCVTAGDGGQVVLVVEDDGPGIPCAERTMVFQRFYRGRAGLHTAGSGLGLAIVQRVAELHDSRVVLGDGPGGRGLSATFTLAAAPPAPEPRSSGARYAHAGVRAGPLRPDPPERPPPVRAGDCHEPGTYPPDRQCR